MFVADNGSDWYISGAPDPRWDDDELATTAARHRAAFEVVRMGRDHSGMSGSSSSNVSPSMRRTSPPCCRAMPRAVNRPRPDPA